MELAPYVAIEGANGETFTISSDQPEGALWLAKGAQGLDMLPWDVQVDEFPVLAGEFPRAVRGKAREIFLPITIYGKTRPEMVAAKRRLIRAFNPGRFQTGLPKVIVAEPSADGGYENEREIEVYYSSGMEGDEGTDNGLTWCKYGLVVRSTDPFFRDREDTVQQFFAFSSSSSFFPETGPFVSPNGPLLNANPDFSIDVSGWSVVNATVTRTTARAHSGPGAALITSTSGVNPRLNSDTKAPVIVGQTYRATGWVYAPAAVSGGVGINVNWYDGTNAYMATSSNATNPAPGGWVMLDQAFTPPDGAASGSIVVAMGNGIDPGTGVQLYADDIRLLGPEPRTGGFRLSAPPVPVNAITVNNHGDIEVYPTWTILGPLSGSFNLVREATNYSPQQVLQVVNLNLADGQTATIVTEPGARRLGNSVGPSVGWPALGVNPQFWTLDPGPNSVSIQGLPAGVSPAQLTVSFRPKYLGI